MHVRERTVFDRAILQGRYSEAVSALDRSERHFGPSLWGIENRLALLQKTSGISAQKAYLESITSAVTDESVGTVAYFISERNEPTTSPSTYTRLLKETLEQFAPPAPYRRYLFFRLLDEVENDATSIADVLAYEEASSLIDYYETFVSLGQHCIAGYASDLQPAFVAEARRLLDIPDSRLQHMTATYIRERTKLRGLRIRSLSYDDAAISVNTSMKGQAPREGSPDLDSAESAFAFAVAYANVEETLPAMGDGIWRELAEAAYGCMSESSNSNDAYRTLYKIRQNFRLCSFASLIDAFAFYEGLDTVVPIRSSEILACLNSNSLEPKYLRYIEDRDAFYALLRARYGDHTTVLAYGAIAGMCSAEALPSVTQDLITVQRAAEDGDWLAVAEAARALRHTTSGRIRRLADRAYVIALYHLDWYGEAIEVAVAFCLANQTNTAMMPIKQLADRLRDQDFRESIATRLSTPILLDLYRRAYDDALDSERNYAFEDYLSSMNIARPSQLRESLHQLDRLELVYYLRYIAVPEVLEGVPALHNSRDVARERFEVCNLLKTLDPENAEQYDAEARSITRAEIIRSGISRAEQSKISVDLPALRIWAEKNQREKYTRYQVLRDMSSTRRFDDVRVMVQSSTGESLAYVVLPRSEADALLKSLVIDIIKEATDNSEYGLDSYLSLRVRHGTLSGQMRSAAAEYHLVTQKESGSNRYQPNEYWLDRLEFSSSAQEAQFTNIMSTFSSSYDDLIEDFKREKLQVRSEDKPDGLFRIEVTQQDLEQFASIVSPDASFEEFFELCFDLFWVKVDACLAAVRSYMDTTLKPTASALLTALEDDIHALFNTQSVYEFDIAVRTASTAVLNTLDAVKSWFQVPKPAEELMLPLSDLVDVALEMVKLPHREFLPELRKPFNLGGLLFPLTKFTDIFYLIFENVQQYSGRQQPCIDVSARISGAVLEVCVESDTIPERRTEAVLHRLAAIRQDIDLNRYQPSVSREGGSGLKKVRRLAGEVAGGAVPVEFGFTDVGRFFIRFRTISNAITAED
jgi:hypothetical protein